MRDHDEDETEVDPYAEYRDQRVELGVLFDLQDHLRFAPREGMNSVLRGALMWAADQGWLAPVVVSVDRMDFDKVIAADLDQAEAISQVNAGLSAVDRYLFIERLAAIEEAIADLQGLTLRLRHEDRLGRLARASYRDMRVAEQSAEGAANPSAASEVAIDAPEDATPVIRHAGPPEGESAPSGSDDQIHEPAAVLPAEVAQPCEPVAPAAAEERPPAPAAAPVAEDRSGQPWAPEEDARLQHLKNQGATAQEIADILGRKTAAVYQRLSVLRNAPPAPPARPMWWREIEAELNALGYRDGWNAEADLMIVEAIAAGDDLQITADALGCEVSQMRARLIAMTPQCVDARGRRKMTPEFQAQLLEVLRARAGKGDA